MKKNEFYEAEDLKKSNPELALEKFENVVILEEQMSDEVDLRFTSLENIVILSAQLGKYDNMVTKQSKLLKLMNKVTKTVVSDAMNNILDAVSTYLVQSPVYQKNMY